MNIRMMKIKRKNRTKNKMATTGAMGVSLALAVALFGMNSPVAGATEKVEADYNEGRTTYIGVGLGAAAPTSNVSSGSVPSIGAFLGHKLSPQAGIGLFGGYYGQTSSGSLLGLPALTAASTALLMGQGSFFLGPLHIGAEVGVGVNSWGASLSTIHAGNSVVALTGGPQGGVDLKLSPAATLGLEVHYLMSAATGSANNLLAMATIKGWM